MAHPKFGTNGDKVKRLAEHLGSGHWGSGGADDAGDDVCCFDR